MFRRPPASWRVLVLGGLLLTLATATAGRLGERARFGADEAAAVERVEREVRAELEARASALRATVATIQAQPELAAAVVAPEPSPERLFDMLRRVGAERAGPDRATTIFAADHHPVAWTGRPSRLPPDRLAGPPALFIAPGALGLRLVYVEPIVAATPAGSRRIGTIAAERVLSPITGVESPATQTFRLATSRGSVVLRPRFAGGGDAPAPEAFLVRAATGDPLVEVHVELEEIRAARTRWREAARGATLAVLALTVLLLGAPLFEYRRTLPRMDAWIAATLLLVLILTTARVLAWYGLPAGWGGAETFRPAVDLPALLRLTLRSPVDFLFTGLYAAALVGLAADAVQSARATFRSRRHPLGRGAGSMAAYVVWHLLAGAGALVVLLAFEELLRATVALSTVDVLHLALHPWDSARLALFGGLLLFHASAVLSIALLFLVALSPWRHRGGDWRVVASTVVCWLTPALIVIGGRLADDVPGQALFLVLGLACAVAWRGRTGFGWFRHGSQVLRLLALSLLLIVPALLLYPSLLYFAEGARRELVETNYAVQATTHPQQLLAVVRQTQSRLDAIPALPELIDSLAAEGPPQTDAAFSLWQQTPLAENRLTSAVELYSGRGELVSRFALNFPEYAARAQRWFATGCDWEVFGEAAPFGAEERRMLHAERGVCDAAGRIRGGIVVHVMPDYSALPFISVQTPYYEFFRPAPGGEAGRGREVGLVIYGWGRTPIYTSTGHAWVLGDAVFTRIYRSRDPFWTVLTRNERPHHVHLGNDRFGIYALDYPMLGWRDHLVHLAELTTFAGLMYVGLLVAIGLLRRLAGRDLRSGPQLVREFRTSFYRKLSLAFIAAAVIPVLILALGIRNYVAGRMRADVEAEAARTAAVAQRVIEEALAAQQGGEWQTSVTDDDGLIWISRVLGQDVNLFAGPELLATSERDLFASGLLPTRVPDTVYRAIVLQRQPSFVGEDEIGGLRYLMAAAPVRAAGEDTIVTVPLASRQREIEREIDDLDRGVQLGALLFIVFGAALGFWMAERIADPVQRLTRASRRIAAGDLDARVFVRSADELKRLVEAFNSMAFELQRQRAQLERTNRLEAWAEMARQVAHDIKNPLTPIQLSAEHLRRVHRDRGEPLSPVLDACVDTILSQVRLLRQIASEFSSFASSPVPKPVKTNVEALLREVVQAYEAGLGGRVAILVDVEPGVPDIMLDRALMGRAIANVIENALHAMPGGGDVRLRAQSDGGGVAITIEDTGAGMDDEALARIFEPYFSTKAIGTGLGLTIAKRNVELHQGSIAVESRRNLGTRVRMWLPGGRDAAQVAPSDEGGQPLPVTLRQPS
jgi:signal transduction histidine kinase